MMKVRQILGSAGSMTQLIGASALLIAGVSLQGCGQKGPLYLPESRPPPPATGAAAEAARPEDKTREASPQR